METNGVANILLTIESLEKDLIDIDLALVRIQEQAILLERYMLAYQDNPNILWHEVRQDPLQYPTLKERNSK